MSLFDEIWSGTALAELSKLPLAARDQVEATASAICRDPAGAADDVIEGGPGGRPVFTARAGSVLVVYQVDEIGEMVYFQRVVDRG